MNTFLGTSYVTRGCAGAVPVARSVSGFRISGLAGQARAAVPAVYPNRAAVALFVKHADKRTGMARLNTIGWPLGPQDRSSG